MLHEIFYWVMNMSIIASVFGILIYFLRYIKVFPRVGIYALWSVVLLRMLCPVGLPSKFSLMNLVSGLADRTVVKTVPLEEQQLTLSNAIQGAATYQPITYKTNVLEEFFQVASVIWCIVAAAAILAMVILYLLTKSELKKATWMEEEMYRGAMVSTPTVYGICKPRIILPMDTEKEDFNYIIAHERVHIKRRDNLWRMIALIAACIHWFNPLSWLFLKTFFNDCELACDETVVKAMEEEERKSYARTLLSYTTMKQTVFFAPFGSSKVKIRILKILSYKQLTWFASLCFGAMVLIIAILLLTNGEL